MHWYSYLYENIMFTNNEMRHCFGKESALGAGGSVERVALIKSLIYARKKERA